MIDTERQIKFFSLSSGSCGNCYFIALEENGALTASVIIDAGVSIRRLKRELEAKGYSLDSFSAILITHDHMDHIHSLGSYCKKLSVPVYATNELHNALAHHTFTRDWIADHRKDLKDDDWTEIVPGKIMARYFVVPHDATQTVGYALWIDGYKFTIMTDLGAMTPEALSYASHSDTVVIESNYDVDMLLGGTYTYELKMRICKGHGHLSNDNCADAIRKFWHPGLKHIFLCHLSENNNTPELALRANYAALESLGFVPSYPKAPLFLKGDEELTLYALPRRTASSLFKLL